ncbi:MAG: hypothetical protein ABSG22_12055 [Sedimentisphaerales bacterium]
MPSGGTGSQARSSSTSSGSTADKKDHARVAPVRKIVGLVAGFWKMIPENCMPIVAKCPSCGASLSETSVLALAPVCGHCGTVITKSGGTLGLTSAYGVNDPTITRKRVEADLAVFCDYRNKYVGTLEAYKEQLNWSVERYVKLPNEPELLPLKPVPSVLYILGWDGGDLRAGITAFFLFEVVALFLSSLIAPPWGPQGNGFHILFWLVSALCLLAVVITSPFYLVTLIIGLVPALTARIANGKRPQENARRQKAYEAAYAVALKAAEPVKAAQDHRLRSRICELEGLITTMTEKAEDVRRILATL